VFVPRIWVGLAIECGMVCSMSTLKEIEAAVAKLPEREQFILLEYLKARLTLQVSARKPTRMLPVIPATGNPITQREIDDALDPE